MVAAWLLHSHSLRQGELYIIQERSVELLRFFRDVATNLGLPEADRSTFLHWITEVRVFGSYLTDADDLGDLDLAIKLERELDDGQMYRDGGCHGTEHAVPRQTVLPRKTVAP
jgi:hypothetical protein